MKDLNWEGNTILIAEDEEINYQYIDAVLQGLGAKILHAWNGEQTIRMVEDNPDINIILMDIKMPIIDGLEATKYIKSKRPDIKIIAQTAYAMNDDRVKCFNAGCDDYLTKPIKKNLLFKSIDNLISVY